MILVTLGTQDKSMVRLLKLIDKSIAEGLIKDKVIVQAGFTKYKSKNMEIFDTVSNDELEKLINKADLIITHGGVGSILSSLKYHKKVIATPRLAKYNEHTNDHQKQIVKEFSKRGYLIPLLDYNNFDKVMEKSKTFKPRPFKSNNENFTKIIKNYIEKDNHISWFNRDKFIILVTIINLLIYTLLTFLKINIYLALTISYVISAFLSKIFKVKKLPNPITVIFCFYLIEGLSLILLTGNLGINAIVSKVIINILVIFIYHFLSKKN